MTLFFHRLFSVFLKNQDPRTKNEGEIVRNMRKINFLIFFIEKKKKKQNGFLARVGPYARVCASPSDMRVYVGYGYEVGCADNLNE